jgi:hypothetical protein
MLDREAHQDSGEYGSKSNGDSESASPLAAAALAKNRRAIAGHVPSPQRSRELIQSYVSALSVFGSNGPMQQNGQQAPPVRNLEASIESWKRPSRNGRRCSLS